MKTIFAGDTAVRRGGLCEADRQVRKAFYNDVVNAKSSMPAAERSKGMTLEEVRKEL